MANFGETLKQARAHKGVTLKEAEQATRINRSHLAALEDENFRALPPLIYQRGIVRNYALYLDLDPARLLALFDDARGGAGTPSHGVQPMPPLNMPTHWAPNFAIISFSLVLSAIVFAWIYSAFVQPPDEQAEATQIVATVTPLANDVPLPTEAPATPIPTTAPEPSPVPTEVVPQEERVDTGRDLPSPTPEPTTAPEPTAVPADTSGGTDNQLQGDQGAGSESESLDIDALVDAASSEQAPAEESPAEAAAPSGEYVTSINVEALDTITISVVADGIEVFQGTLQPGEQTPFYNGSFFEVFTTSGASTLFTNACGFEFYMGEESGEATYNLNADENSCPPIG